MTVVRPIALANISRTLTQHKPARRRSRVKAVAADADTLDSAAGFTAPDPFPAAFGVWGSQQGILERLPACLVPRYYWKVPGPCPDQGHPASGGSPCPQSTLAEGFFSQARFLHLWQMLSRLSKANSRMNEQCFSVDLSMNEKKCSSRTFLSTEPVSESSVIKYREVPLWLLKSHTQFDA